MQTGIKLPRTTAAKVFGFSHEVRTLAGDQRQHLSRQNLFVTGLMPALISMPAGVEVPC
jgi:hypothetical protein